jgi:hypothetical protein
VPEPPTKTIKIIGHAIEFFLAFQRTRLELFHLLGIMQVWGANLLRVARVSTITNRLVFPVARSFCFKPLFVKIDMLALAVSFYSRSHEPKVNRCFLLLRAGWTEAWLLAPSPSSLSVSLQLRDSLPPDRLQLR